MDKVLIFGIGVWYQRYKKIVFNHAEVVGLIDNNSSMWGKTMDQIYIENPCTARTMEYDYVLLLSAKAVEMYQQLVDIGIPQEKIIYWEQYRANIYAGQFRFVGNKSPSLKKSIAILTPYIYYNGGTMAAIYAALAMRNKGYGVVLCAPEADERMLCEIEAQGLYVAICPEIPYVGEEFKCWIEQFDFVIVNVLLLIRCASEIGQIRPTIWWIHESSDEYSDTYKKISSQFSEYWCTDKISACKIIAVSQIAKNNFNHYFPDLIKDTLPFGIPDLGVHESKSSKIVFAVIGALIPLKAQDVFISAIEAMDMNLREQCEFWLIGRDNGSTYANRVKYMAKDEPYIQFKGEYSRKEIETAYKQIDVVICSSLEETMSITIVEGMMHGKLVITTDATGIADYITDGVNGFVCEAGNVRSLSRKMQYIIEHYEALTEVRKRAREVYEEYFSIEVFEENLDHWLDTTG